MTAQGLAEDLGAFLTNQLGKYSWPGGVTRPAINVGSPDSEVGVSGLEVIIDVDPEYDNQNLNAHTAVVREIPVRFIPHDGVSATTAIERVCQRWLTSPPTTVPGDESLGISKQYVLRIRGS